MRRRGLHLHTLHPIEGLFDFWLSNQIGNARRVVDWLVKNRGNFLQWVALDDILQKERYAGWLEATLRIIDYAHARGVQIGLNTEVFASSSLQNAYITDSEESLVFLQELPFDLINLSFGEFIGEDPQRFIDTLARTATLIESVRPGCQISSTVHVGNFENLRIEYQGKTMLYYFLVQYVPEVVPWVHSVMYYNLYEDAGGAYRHEQFDEHRDFMLERIAAGLPVAYFPESAYWIAFDNSVPTYLPLYIRSRWLDMHQTAELAPPGLSEHVLFSSGWEWGYWQNDYLTLRMNYELPGDWRDAVEQMLEPLEKGDAAAELVISLAQLQQRYLVEKRLAAYFAAVDFWIEAGHYSGIISQPYRVLVPEAAQLDQEGKAKFRSEVLGPLGEFSGELAALVAGLERRPLGADAWSREIRDGLEIDALRARFVGEVYRAAIDWDLQALDRAKELFAKAEAVVRRRHAGLHYPTPGLLLAAGENPTIYHFGYLKQADTLCLWQRELVEAERALGKTQERVPWCIE